VKFLNLPLVFRLLAALLAIVASFMLLPLALALLLGENQVLFAFLIPLSITLLASIILIPLLKTNNSNLGPREGFLLVSLGWIFMSILGACPYVLSGYIPNISEAFFETMSGFTTTGASVLQNIEILPQALLFWRSLTHWLGGMGVIALTVAIIPMLGVGGLQLMRAETPGPDVDKLTPKLTQTAKILWLLYVGFTFLETLLLWLGGMSFLDALNHSFATMATGGFSTKNLSLGAWDSPFIHWVVTLFMFLAGVNFVLYFKILRGKTLDVLHNTEFKVYCLIFFVSGLLVSFGLWRDVYASLPQALEQGFFQVASILTTTGFMTADFGLWPSFVQAIFLALMFIGGSTGSTGGGIKVLRISALVKLGFHEAKKMIHPRAVFTFRLNKSAVKKELVYPLGGFIALYLAIVFASTIIIAASGLDLLSSFTASLACLGNVGPGLGAVGPSCNYAFLSDGLTLFLSFLMLLGRLELFTVLVLFMPKFWSR